MQRFLSVVGRPVRVRAGARTAATIFYRLGAAHEQADAFYPAGEAIGEFSPKGLRRGWRGGRIVRRRLFGLVDQVQVAGGGFEQPVVKVFLQFPDRSAVLQEMHGVAVPQGDRQHDLLQSGPFGDFPHQHLDPAGA